MKKLLLALLFLTPFIIIKHFDMEIAIIVGCLSIPLYGFICYRDKSFAWIYSITISFIWIFIARKTYYGYENMKYTLFGISVFPIIAWPTLLTLGYFFLSDLFHKIQNWKLRWFSMFAIYSVLLILMEYIGYHLLGIHLEYGKVYTGWKYLNIFHSPVWMQIGYFLNGFIFSGIVNYPKTPFKPRSFPNINSSTVVNQQKNKR